VAKYWNTKRAPQFVYETMEILGGNGALHACAIIPFKVRHQSPSPFQLSLTGYVEQFPMARHFRQSPLNSIW
jgi:alkylation response protein AidB-like acyl-CoA dehydrogenase